MGITPHQTIVIGWATAIFGSFFVFYKARGYFNKRKLEIARRDHLLDLEDEKREAEMKAAAEEKMKQEQKS